jgi:hypothetical protein
VFSLAAQVPIEQGQITPASSFSEADFSPRYRLFLAKNGSFWLKMALFG